MAITTTLATQFEDQLVAALRARPGLTDDQVIIGPVGSDLAAGDYIITGVGIGNESVSSDEEFNILGNVRRQERITLNCFIEAHRPGAGELAVQAARDAAHALLAEVAEELRTAAFPENNHPLTLGGLAHMFELSAWDERRGATTNARWSQIPFQVTYVGDLPSS